MSKISVIIPYYNGHEYISEALDSIVNQTYQNLEIIIVNDCSQSDSVKELKKIVAGYDHNIKIVDHIKNKGIPNTRNTGVDNSDGEYIAFLDQDDVWLSEKLEKQIKCFNEFSNLGIVYCNLKTLGSENDVYTSLPNPYNLNYDELQNRIFDNWIFASCSALLIKRECLDKKGLFDTGFYSGEEIEFAMRIIKEYKIFFINEPLILKRKHAGNASGSLHKQFEVEKRLLYKFIEYFPRFKVFKKNRLSKIYSNYAKSFCELYSFKDSLKYTWNALRLNPLNTKSYLVVSYCLYKALEKQLGVKSLRRIS